MLAGEFSLGPGSDASRMLMSFHGGGYCSGSIVSHRRRNAKLADGRKALA